MPVRSNSIEYFYNVDHFEEVGLDPNNPPKTWDEMMDAAIKLTKKDSAGNTIRYGCDVGFWSSNLQQAVHYWSSVFWSYGGNYLENGKAGFNTEAGVKACQYWYDMVNVHGVSPVDQVDGGFESAAISMFIGGEWNIAPFDAVEGLNYNIMTMPSAAIGKDPVIPMGGRYTAIPAASKHPAEAFEFISYIMSRDVQLKYTSTGIGLRGGADIEDDQFFIDNPKYKSCA